MLTAYPLGKEQFLGEEEREKGTRKLAEVDGRIERRPRVLWQGRRGETASKKRPSTHGSEKEVNDIHGRGKSVEMLMGWIDVKTNKRRTAASLKIIICPLHDERKAVDKKGQGFLVGSFWGGGQGGGFD